MYLLSLLFLKNIFLKSKVQLSESLDIKCIVNVYVYVLYMYCINIF